jgi:hypothetical protein
MLAAVVPRKKRSDLDDLSFDMNFDSETAQRIRAIAAAKERAVQQEDYDTAKVSNGHVQLVGLVYLHYCSVV